VRIKIDKTGEFPDFEVLFKAFPRLSARILGYIGKEAAVELAGMMERGTQGVTFRNMDGNRRGPDGSRRMISYSIGRGLKWVSISSFPLNLFEGGRMLRSGRREAPRNIIRKKLRAGFSGRLQSIINNAESFIVDDWFNDRKKGGIRQI